MPVTFGSPPVISAVPPGSESDGSAVVVGVLLAAVGELGQFRARLVGHVPLGVGLVHPVDGDQQHVLDPGMLRVLRGR
jgi:hypothetical protein